MSDVYAYADEFKREVDNAASVLTSRGFTRAPQFENDTVLTLSRVYMGRHVAFTFTLDIRDRAIGLLVSRVADARIPSEDQGGYTEYLSAHLVYKRGFRGRSGPGPAIPGEPSVRETLSAWADLLMEPCAATLLADRADALS